MKGLIVAGYGGHAGYAYAISSELVKHNVQLDILLPRRYEYLEKKFANLGKIIYITLPRRPLEPIYKGVHRWFMTTIESISLSRNEYDFIFSAGSNFSISPSIFLKVFRNVYLFTLEDVNRFSRPSKSVKLLKSFGGIVFLHWEEQLSLYQDGIVVGPVFEPRLYEPIDEGYVLVTLGTLGSREVFDTVVKLNLDKLVIQTGDLDPTPYAAINPNWIVFKYTDDMHRWLAKASVVVTHPGTTAVTARLAYNKPVVLIYTKRHAPLYPMSDVEELTRKLNAIFVSEINTERLLDALNEAKKLEKPKVKIGSVEASKLMLDLASK